MLAIETEGLTKDYTVGFWRPRPYRALDALTLQVEAGEVFGFLGPNGAGKSTTLKLLMQLIYPTSGQARILGQPAGDVATRRRIGFLAENPSYYDYLTAEELLAYFASLHGYRGEERTRRVAAALDAVELGAERRMRLRSYSKGMVQRVGLAQAILHDPEVIFLDEPMSGLDPLGRRHVRALMIRLRDRGCTVFFSSHVLSDAESLCTRVAVMAQGRLVATGRVADIVGFEVQGWDLVVDRIEASAVDALGAQVRRVTPLPDGKFDVLLGPDVTPDEVLRALTARGGRVISLNPVRQTLEDFFVQAVGRADRRDTGGL